MHTFPTLFAQLARQKKVSFLKKTQDVQHYQSLFLTRLLTAHQNTQFGQEHQLSQIKSIDDYRSRVPVRSYQDHEPYILRMSEGEKNILVSDNPIYFNITSGSTGKVKLIPVTRASRRYIQRASSTATGFLADASLGSKLPFGKILFPASVNAHGQTKSGQNFAPVSTSDLKLSNPISRLLLCSPYAAHQISDLKSRQYICLLFALSDPNLRIMAETFPVTMLKLCQFLEDHAESLIQDLAMGTLAPWLKLDAEQKRFFHKKLPKQLPRARILEQIMKKRGLLTPEHVWPQLSFLITAKGGTSDFYFRKFPKYFGNTPIFGGIYSSAEATYGVHQGFNTDGVLLALESGFYEFIPKSQWDEAQPETVLPWQVKVGEFYRILVTNYSGFYRYDVGDIVEIVGFHHHTPIFIFRHRYKGFITSVGEKTTEYHVTQVINALQEKHELVLENFCVTLTEEIPPRYVVNIELPCQGNLPNPEQFIQDFDHLLGEVHHFYQIKRQDQVQPPDLRVLASGSFQQWQQDLVHQGIAESQIKIPKISNDRTLFSQSHLVAEYSMSTHANSL